MNNQIYIKLDKVHTFVSHEALSFGDYGGASAVGRSNIDAIRSELESRGWIVADVSASHFEACTTKHMEYAPVWNNSEFERTLNNPRHFVAGVLIRYGTGEDLYLRTANADCMAILDSLDVESVYSDDAHSATVAEWTENAIPHAVRDVTRLIDASGDNALIDAHDEYTLECQHDFMRRALRYARNYAPSVEDSSVYIDAQQVYAAYVREVRIAPDRLKAENEIRNGQLTLGLD